MKRFVRQAPPWAAAALLPVLSILLAVAGCSRKQVEWEGYALRDRPGEDGTRLVGAYGTLDGCRAGLLASDSDASSEALVCTRGCSPPVRGLLEKCEATRVIRAVQTDLSEDGLVNDTAEPAGVAAPPPDSGPSQP